MVSSPLPGGSRERQTNQIEKQAYRISEFCFAYGIGRTKAYEEIKNGRLKIDKKGRMTFISRAAAEAWFGQRDLDGSAA